MSRHLTIKIDAARINPFRSFLPRRRLRYASVSILPPKRETRNNALSSAVSFSRASSPPRRSVTQIKTKLAKNISRRKKSRSFTAKLFHTAESYSRRPFLYFFFRGVIFAVFLSSRGLLIYSSASNCDGNETSHTREITRPVLSF